MKTQSNTMSNRTFLITTAILLFVGAFLLLGFNELFWYAVNGVITKVNSLM